MHVWAVGDSFRIDATTGKAFEANSLVFPDAPGGNYRQSNLVWDGARKADLAQSGAQRDRVFPVDRRAGRRMRRWPRGREGRRLDRARRSHAAAKSSVELFKEWYVNITKTIGAGLFARHGLVSRRSDSLHALDGQAVPEIVHPAVRCPRPAEQYRSRPTQPGGLGRCLCSRDRRQAPPGTTNPPSRSPRRPAIAWSSSLNLSVWDFALPEETHLAGNIHNDTELNTLTPELELKYYQMIRRHRLAMGVLGYAPDTTVNGSDIQFDWTSYDARLGRYLDGSAFTEKYGYSGPGYGVPIELLVLPFDAYPVNIAYNSDHVGWPYGKEWKFYRPWPVDVPKGGVNAGIRRSLEESVPRVSRSISISTRRGIAPSPSFSC